MPPWCGTSTPRRRLALGPCLLRRSIATLPPRAPAVSAVSGRSRSSVIPVLDSRDRRPHPGQPLPGARRRDGATHRVSDRRAGARSRTGERDDRAMSEGAERRLLAELAVAVDRVWESESEAGQVRLRRRIDGEGDWAVSLIKPARPLCS
jgi:hypothetical protein